MSLFDRRGKFASAFILAALAIGLVVGAMQLAPTHAQSQDKTAVPSSNPVWNPYAIADVAEAITPAVVYIEVEWPVPETTQQVPLGNDFFREFFGPWPFSQGPQSPQAEPAISRGTGFIVDAEGHILTNQHVVGDVGNKQTITVKLSTPDFSGEVKAKLLGSDRRLDLAVLQIQKPKELKQLPSTTLGNSDNSRVGEWLIAIGNPFGAQFEHTVTVGVLSAKGRQIQVWDDTQGSARVYTELMQTDAAINPGNSGGPLVNVNGEVIGINTAVNAQAQGIGFAIPINKAVEVMDQLIHKGKVVRPWLGIYHSGIDKRIADYFGLPDTKGVIVRDVIANSPAGKAGLKQYDVIHKVNGTVVESQEQFGGLFDDMKPGDKVLLEVFRDGDWKLIPVVLEERPSDKEF